VTDIVYGIRLAGDASSAKRAFEETAQAEERLRTSTAQLTRQQGEGRRELDQFVGAARRQAETLGMTRGQVLQYDAAQKGLNETQRAAVRSAGEAIDAYDRKEKVLARLKLAAAAAGAAITAGVVAALKGSVSAAAEAERSVARLNAVWLATGGTAGLSRAQLGDLAEGMAIETRFDDETIRDAMALLMTFRTVSHDTFTETMRIAASLAEVTGNDLRGAVLQLGRALEDPVEGLTALRRSGVSFTETEREMIQQLVEHGRRADAARVILQALKTQGFDQVAESMNQGLNRALADAGKNWNDLLDAIGQTRAVQAPAIGFFGSLAYAAGNLRRVIEEGTWFERLRLLGVLGPAGTVAGWWKLATEAPQEKPGADPNSREAVAARWAGQQALWQRDFDAQQRGMREHLKKLDDAAKQSYKQWVEERRQQVIAEQLHLMRGQAGDELRGFKEDADWEREEREHELRTLNEINAARVQTREEMERNSQALRESIDPLSAYNAQLRQLNHWLEQGVIDHAFYGQAVAEAQDRMVASLERLRDKGTETYEDLKRAVEGWGRDTSRALAQAAVQGRLSFESLGDAARRFAEDLIAIQIQRRFMDPWLKAGTRWLDNLSSGGSSGGVHDVGGSFGVFHAGGIVGGEPPLRRYVSAAALAGARRMHSGGIAGDEEAIIARKGEGVFTPQQMRQLAPVAGGLQNVRVEIVNKGAPMQVESVMPLVDVRGAVISIVTSTLARDAGFRDQLRSALLPPR